MKSFYLVLIGLLWSACLLAKPHIEYDTVVVGAGVSGLKAARDLKKSGKRVLVLEARDRIAGRIKTVSKLGMTVDLGASWIHGYENNPIYKLALKNNIKTVSAGIEPSFQNGKSNVSLYDKNGQPISGHKLMEIMELYEDFLEFHAKQQQNPLYSNLSMQQVFDAFTQEEDLDVATTAYIRHAAGMLIEYDHAENLSNLSVHFDEGLEFQGEDRIFPQGYKQVPEVLARQLGYEHIRLNESVSEIRVDKATKQVSVITKQGQRYYARTVVVTVPIGILKAGHIKFVPELPESKQSAIKNLKMGLLNKIVLKFSIPFWDQESNVISVLSESG